MIFEKGRAKVISWGLYDWANSAFATTILAGFFPVFFKKYWCEGVDVAVSTSRLGMTSAIAGLLIALMSPALGALGNDGSIRKRLMTIFALLGMGATALFYAVPMGEWLFAGILIIVARIGFNMSILFNDAMLPDVSKPKNHDMISSFGFGLGYLGGGLLFAINLVMFSSPSTFGLADGTEAVKWSFVSVAVWWFLFTIPVWVFVKPVHGVSQSKKDLIKESLVDLKETGRALLKNKNILYFLIAFWFYNDGVHTVIFMGVDFGMSLGLDASALMKALLIVQFVSLPCVLLWGYITRYIGTRNVILISIVMYFFLTLGAAWILKSETHFYLFAAAIGIVQGPAQALSRSLFTTLIPQDKASGYFGFYNMIGRFAVILGPLLIGLVNYFLHMGDFSEEMTTRWGITSIVVLFLGGIIFLFKVENRTEAQ